MNPLSTLISVFVALLVSGECHISHGQTPVTFLSVMIESHPKGWGYAHKTVEKTGTVTGAHISGGPEAVRVYETKAELAPDDMIRLTALVAALRYNPPKSGAGPPDQKSEGYTSVTILFDNKKTITAHTTLREQFKFEHPNLQAIWDLVYKYNVGAW